MGWAALAGGAASLIGSKMASDSASDSADKANKLTREQMRRLDAIDLPDEEKMRLALDNPELVGLLQAENIDPSKMGEIALDPKLRENQMAALAQLKNQADEGLTSTDKYAMEQLLGDVSANQRSQQAAIESDMARRGMDSSGAALMAKMQAGQQGANDARAKAMQMASQGQLNRRAALQALGQQSGNMERQDFNRKASIASAQDAIQRANAMNRQNVSGQNLAARQGIENQRSNLSNQQQIYNKGLEQQQFDNKLKKVGQQNVASQNASNAANAIGQAQAGAASNMMNVAGNLGSAYLQYGNKAEDGGIARSVNMPIQYQNTPMDQEYRAAEMKQHEGFKKKYMKRIQDEVMGSYQDKPKTPAKPEGKTGYEGNNAADGGVMKDVTTPSEIPERGGTDFASPNDRNSAIMAALLSEMKNMDPEQNVPMKRADGGPMYASDGQGDIIDSGEESYAGDRVDAKVNDGEIVINLPQQQRLMEMLRGEIGIDELGSDDIVEGVPKEYRDDMHKELKDESECGMMGSKKEDESEEYDMEGMKKLMEMLGK